MKQPIKGQGKVKKKRARKTYSLPKTPYNVKERLKLAGKDIDEKGYGTSKLERDFARDFLDKYDVMFIYQYEAKDIKRFYDFAIVVADGHYEYEVKDGIKCIKNEPWIIPDALIELDGGYWHSDPRVVNEKKLTPMQKHNKFVDSIKDRWALMHHIPLLRIWEYDVRHNPKDVVDEMSKYIAMAKTKNQIKENKKKPR